ncbi:MAG: type IV pilus biogenesis/stability protein PilW [Sulfuricella sp.]|nr:type IV pilus biogenesis/stability protein PilW [Sulfuricella sp.]
MLNSKWLAILLIAVSGMWALVAAADDGPSGSRQRAQIHTELGAAYFGRDQMGVALSELNEAVRLDSSYAPAYNILGLVYMALREDAKAEESFRRSLSLDSADSDAHNNYGWFLCQRGKSADSIAHFMVALKNPLYATPEKSYLNAGICARKNNNDADAEEFLMRSLRLQPRQPQALFHMADINFKRGNFNEAKNFINRYSQVAAPTIESLWLGLRIERKLGDRSAEASYGLQLRKMYPDAPETQALRAGKFE